MEALFDYSGCRPRRADMQKPMDAIQAVDSGDPPLCGGKRICRISTRYVWCSKPYHLRSELAAGAYGYG